MALSPELAMMLHDIPVRASFAVMLAFSEPLSSVRIHAGHSHIGYSIIHAYWIISSND